MSSLRLQKITNVSPRYLARFYAERPGLDAQPFSDQHAALMADSFGWAEFWSVALAKLGYEANEVVANVLPMQKRWALDNGVAFDENSWALEVAAAQVSAFRPDVLFVADHHNFPAAYVRQLKSDCPSIRLTIGWCGAPYSDPSIFNECDFVLSCIPELVEHFRRQGHRSYHLNHAFEPRILDRIRTTEAPTVDFAFIGSIVKKDKFHTRREELLLDLVKRTGLELWTETYRPSLQQTGSAFLRRSAYDAVQTAQGISILRPLIRAAPLLSKVERWEERPSLPQGTDELILRRAHPPLFGLPMFQQLHDSRVALNTHIDISPESASNMRLFEATGVGTALLTDWKANLPDLFESDLEMVSYRSSEECIEKVRYLLDHEDERQRIARAGQRRTLRDHTFAQRARQLDALIHDAILSKA
jgi:hypothetical protein